MKKRVAVAVVALCLVAALIQPAVRAAGSVYFTAINNTVNPLSAETMPTTINGLLYIPYTFFSSAELGVYFGTGSDKVMIYAGSKYLVFDLIRSTVFDQDNNQHWITAQKIGGLIYVPVDMVCVFFGVDYKVIDVRPAPIIRFYKGPVYNEPTFVSINRIKMNTYYDAYTGAPAVSASPGTPPASPSPPPTYESITVFLSYCRLTPESFEAILNTLETYRLRCCFFVSAGEIARNADLLRRAAGAGHTLGIWLENGTLEEYKGASALLFEAVKLRTILIAADGDAAAQAAATANAKGLVFWSATKSFDTSSKLTLADVTGSLSVLSGSRESISFACTEQTAGLSGQLLTYLAEKKYTLRRITERTVPTYTVG